MVKLYNDTLTIDPIDWDGPEVGEDARRFVNEAISAFRAKVEQFPIGCSEAHAEIDWLKPLIPARRLGGVGLNRNTFLGWIARYPGLGIEPVKPGVTRLLSVRDVFVCLVAKHLGSMVDMPEAARAAQEAAGRFRALASETRLHIWAEFVRDPHAPYSRITRVKVGTIGDMGSPTTVVEHGLIAASCTLDLTKIFDQVSRLVEKRA